MCDIVCWILGYGFPSNCLVGAFFVRAVVWGHSAKCNKVAFALAYAYLWLRRRYGRLGNAQINLAFRSAYAYLCGGEPRRGCRKRNEER